MVTTMAEYTITATEAALLDILSPDQLEEYIKNNPTKADEIKAAMKANADAKALAEAEDEFFALLDTIDLPPPPPGILNIYRPFRKVTRHLTDSEAKELKASQPDLSDDDIKTRVIDTGKYDWGKWEKNKSFNVGKSTSGSSPKRTRKLAVTVNKRDGNTITPVGNFRTSKEACDHFNLDTKTDSARRVLEAHGYIVDDYDGDQFLVSEK